MSGCRSHADQVGPYVLGALEPDEMDEMRLHLASARDAPPRCGRSPSCPALLDLVQADDEVAVPSPGLEDEVLDRFVRERARSAPRRRRWPRLAIPAVAVAALLAALLVVVLPGDTNTAYAHADLWSLPAGGGAEGTADVAAVPAGTRVKLRADHLPVSEWGARTSCGACAPTVAGSTAGASTPSPTAPRPRSSPRESSRASTTWS